MTAVHTGHKSPNWLVAHVLEKADVAINGTRPWDVRVRNTDMYRRVLTHGSLGLGEGYIAGDWEAEDVVAFLERLIRTPATFWLQIPETVSYLWRTYGYNAQTRAGAMKVIDAHYDLPLAFFQHTLDRDLVYTSGHWGQAQTLEDAQLEKIDLLLDRASLRPGMTLLDIGGGFGALARRAVTKYKAHSVVLTTLSRVQADYARNACAGMPITERMCDYRDTTGEYDRIVSCEMIEAVGKKNLATYFATAHTLLAPDGVFALQAIVSRLPYGISNAYLEKYIFPGGYLPTEEEIIARARPHFVSTDQHAFGKHYALTLAQWRANLRRNAHHFDERFVRTHEFYFMLCEAAFRAERIDVVQLALRRT